MNHQFQGKKLLVVGGTSGMGLQVARRVLAEGGSAVVVGHRASGLLSGAQFDAWVRPADMCRPG